MIQRLERLVNDLYMSDDGGDQKHHGFCVIGELLIIVIGVSVIVACW